MRDLLERNLIPVRWYDVDHDPESAAMLDWLQIPREETPVLVRNAAVLRNPSAAQVARDLGLRAEIDGERFDLVVLGGGPAGLAAAVYGGSEGLRTLVTEAWAPGGQAGTSTRIENYLGFPTGISGQELARKATLQARRFDAVLSSFHRAVELAAARGAGPTSARTGPERTGSAHSPDPRLDCSHPCRAFARRSRARVRCCCSRTSRVARTLSREDQMAGGTKKKTTMAKLNREAKLRDKRARKAERKDARKLAASLPPVEDDATMASDADVESDADVASDTEERSPVV